MPTPGTEAEHLFVYGTLRRAFGHPMHRLLARHADYAGEATYQGRLYDLGPYPGVLPSDQANEEVKGELYALYPGTRADLLARLDAYEGCGPPGEALYRREKHVIYARDGAPVQAWVYLYNRPLTGARRIFSGDYLTLDHAPPTTDFGQRASP